MGGSTKRSGIQYHLDLYTFVNHCLDYKEGYCSSSSREYIGIAAYIVTNYTIHVYMWVFLKFMGNQVLNMIYNNVLI